MLRSVLGEVHVLWRHIENTRLERNRGGEETGDDTDYDDKLVNKWPGILRPVNHYSYIRASYNDDDDKKEKKKRKKKKKEDEEEEEKEQKKKVKEKDRLTRRWSMRRKR